MRLFDVKKILAAEVITGEHLLGRRVEVIFGCLLISDTLGVSNSPFLLIITALTNIQVFYAAEIMGAVGVVFTDGKKPSGDLIKMASERELPLLTTRYSFDETCSKLSAAGLPGCYTRDAKGCPMPDLIELEFKVKERDFLIAGEAASKTKKTLQRLNVDPEIIRKVMIIVYEAVMNIVIHARFGTLKVFITPERITIVAEDIGKGIPDIGLAMQEGYSTAPREIREMGFGAGMGLPNIRRCADKLTIRSRIEVGVALKALVYLSREKAEMGWEMTFHKEPA
ncbi:MAG: ATP-binding protein [Bacillota bacterium]